MKANHFVALDDEHTPVTSGGWIAPSAILAGDVTLGALSSVWYAAVLRGDADSIVVGRESNLQDGGVVHADRGSPAILGDRVTVGHRAVLHGCRIDDEVLIGMGAIVLTGAVIGSGSLVAAGSVVLEGAVVAPGSLVAGVPARVVRATTVEECVRIVENAREYVALAAWHATATGDPRSTRRTRPT